MSAGVRSCVRCHELLSARSRVHACRDWQREGDPRLLRRTRHTWPWKAWPPSCIDGEWLSSPLPGMGPGLALALLRHRRHRDGGRYVDAMAALLDGTADPLAEALSEPVVLQADCGGVEHPVVIDVRGDAATPEHPEAEHVAAALGDEPSGCLQLRTRWRQRSCWFGHHWLFVLAAADAWRSAGEDLAEADGFIRFWHGPEVVRAAEHLGLPRAVVARWQHLLPDLDLIRRWHAVGCTPAEAVATRLAPEELRAYREEGLDVPRTLEALRLELSAAVAGRWHRAGRSLRTAAALQAMGVEPEDVVPVGAAVRAYDEARRQVVCLWRDQVPREEIPRVLAAAVPGRLVGAVLETLPREWWERP